jgi:phage terminase large subunit-like protein
MTEISRDAQEQALALLQELERRQATDPLRIFQPHKKQELFIERVLNGTPMENWFVGANRSGKSDVGAVAGSKLARFGNPNAKFQAYKGSDVQVRSMATSGWVVSLDFPSSRDVIQPKYFNNGFMPPNRSHEPFIPEREIDEWRQDDQILKLKNGSIIGFKSAESGAGKFQGTEKDWAHFDEVPPKRIYDETVIRVGTSPLKIFGTCTILPPEGQVGGVSWLYSDIIKPVLNGQRKDVAIVNASIYDNPHIPLEEIRRLEAKYREGSIERRIRLNGELLPGLSGARAYTGFDSRLHVRPQPPINLRRPLAWCWDFNVEPLVTIIGQKEGHLFRVYREFWMEQGSIPEMCQWFRDVHKTHFAEIWVYGDATGKRRNAQSNQTDYTVILNEMKGYGAPVKLKVPEVNPSIPDRINAVNVACMNEEGLISLEIDPTCEQLIQDLEDVLRDNRGGIKKSTDKKDPYFWRTHVSDELGYWISYEAPVRLGSNAPGVQKSVKIPKPSYGGGQKRPNFGQYGRR